MLMLIDTADPRYGGSPDPDEERERRWQPVSRRIFVPMAGSLSCVIISGLATPLVAYMLDILAIALCLYAVRAAWPRRDRHGADCDPPNEPPGAA
jgi:hypothetical protein